jgi:gas vesicle protein
LNNGVLSLALGIFNDFLLAFAFSRSAYILKYMARFGKIGWLAGLIFGALFGVLFAPEKGKDLRQRIRTDRKKGGLGLAPLKRDMQHLGKELAGIARDIYQSGQIKELIELGRGKMKNLSDDFVDEVADFHTTRIQQMNEAKKKLLRVKRKAGESVKVGKKAVNEIKKIIKGTLKKDQ